jgi:hypothetical protein
MTLSIGTGLTISGGITFHRIPPPAPWTWDPAYVGTPGLTLSNGNLVVTADSNQGGLSVLGTYPIPLKSKIMFSVCALAVTTTYVSAVGVGSHAMNVNSFIGDSTATSQGVYENGGNYTQTGSPEPTGLTYASLDTIDVAIDRVNGLFWYRVNNFFGGLSDWNDGYNSADPATATGGYPISDLVGTVYPAAGPYYNVANNPPTGTFGANSEPGGAVPTGFTFVAAVAPVWYWNSLGSALTTVFSGRTITDTAPGAYSALGSYAVGDTARVMYTVKLDYDAETILTQNQAVGFGLNSTNLEDALGTTDKSMAVLNTGEVYWNGIQIYTGLPTFVAGDVIDVAVTGTYVSPGWWYRVNGGDWNGDPTADPATNTGGLLQYVDDTASPIYPAVSIAGSPGPGGGPSVFTIQDVPLYPVPAGFTFLGTSQTVPPVSAGLQVNLDAATYLGSGPWIDSVNAAQYALFNNPDYSSSIGGGSFGFDPALGQYSYCSSTLPTFTNWTVEVWHYYDGTYSNAQPCIITQEFASGVINFALGSLATSAPNVQAGFFNGGWQTQAAQTLTPGNWYQIVATCNGTDVSLYINKVQVSSAPWSGAPPSSSTGGTYLMHRWDAADFWGGRLGIVRIYDTDIGLAGVEQNWAADQSRFGL